MWGVYGHFTWASYKEVIGDIKGGIGIVFLLLRAWLFLRWKN